MDGEQPDQEIEGMRQAVQALLNRVGELERMTARGSARERELSTRVEELTRALVRNQGHDRGRVKDISESKAIMVMKLLGGDRAAYKEWRAKFVNVMSQLGPGIRPILKCRDMHKDEKLDRTIFDVANDDDRCGDKFDDWIQDMRWVLVEKTIGEALLRERSGARTGHASVPQTAKMVRETNGHGPGRVAAKGNLTDQHKQSGKRHCQVH